MKTTQARPAHLIEEERRIKQELTEKILRLTDRIPKKVLNDLDQRGAARFKEVAFKARKVATSSKPSLGALRGAYISIEDFYRD